MSRAQRPRLASWLLRRFAVGPQRESLIGDLDEQLVRGRSSLWYWRQVVSAILLGVGQDLREHWRLAIGSTMLTWVFVIVWVESTLALYLWVGEMGVNVWVEDSVLFYFWHPFSGGLCLVWCLGSAANGWLIARWSRPAMVVAAALAQLPLALWWSSSVWFYAERWAGSPGRLWFPAYVGAIVVIVGMPTATLLGGLWQWRKDPVQPPVP